MDQVRGYFGRVPSVTPPFSLVLRRLLVGALLAIALVVGPTRALASSSSLDASARAARSSLRRCALLTLDLSEQARMRELAAGRVGSMRAGCLKQLGFGSGEPIERAYASLLTQARLANQRASCLEQAWTSLSESARASSAPEFEVRVSQDFQPIWMASIEELAAVSRSPASAADRAQSESIPSRVEWDQLIEEISGTLNSIVARQAQQRRAAADTVWLPLFDPAPVFLREIRSARMAQSTLSAASEAGLERAHGFLKRLTLGCDRVDLSGLGVARPVNREPAVIGLRREALSSTSSHSGRSSSESSPQSAHSAE